MMSDAGIGGGCFPIRCFSCCPPSVSAFIPGTWQKIQDWTHLSLVVGVIASVLLVLDTVLAFLHFPPQCGSFFCIQEVIALLFIGPCIFYFVRIIGQYDDRLQAKQRDAKEQKEQLTKAYNNLLADMDGLLTKSAESSAGLAERSFESKRRDFQRFLERAKSRYSQIFGGSKGENDKLMENFRRFVLNWLRVFEECSIDPIQCPKRVVTLEELNRCMSIGEVCDLTLERLRVTEVRFISIQRDQDAQMIRKTRNEFRRLTVAADPRQLAALENGSPLDQSGFVNRPLTTELNAGAGSRKSGRCTWFSCGSGSCGFKKSPTSDGYPKELGLCLCRLVILSREHGMLITGFIVGWVIMLLEFFQAGVSNGEDGISLAVVIEVALNEICLIVLLTRFEEIDVIQQLEREVAELKKAEQAVQTQREKMHEFWSQAQQLTELWLYRTVPRLDLYKEVHSHLEDAPHEDLNKWMKQANEQLENVDRQLGDLVAWRNEGTLSLEAKKSFGKTINQLCQEQEFEHIAKKLDDISRNGLRCLEAPPSASPPAQNKNQLGNLAASAGDGMMKMMTGRK